MSEDVRGLIVAHSSLAEGMAAAVRQISGVGEEALGALSNEGRGPEGLLAAVRGAVGDSPVILFTDLASGSCALAARKLSIERPGTGIVCGVNLAVLLDFVFHRDLPLGDLVTRLVEKGRGGITGACTEEAAHADRALRVDERLIHGQVVVGWGEHLHMDRIVVVDDELNASAWEQELYCLGVPPSVDALFVDVDEARRSYPRWRSDTRRLVVLVRDLATLARIAEGGLLDGETVNLGGLHHSPGRQRVLPYLFLSGEERDQLAAISDTGARISARDLPGTREVLLPELLRTD